jgi:two-component system invasion response regulator UvrY
MIRIIIADDHPIVRKGLKLILEESSNIKVEDEAESGEELLHKLSQKKFDLVLLDISMPGRSGLDILKQIKLEKKNLPVLILSIHPEEQYAIRAIKAGASGYLTKDSAPEELINAINKVIRGKKYISTTLAEKIAVELDDNFEKPHHKKLSDREYEIMCLLCSGLTISEIGKKLNLSIKTISTYKARIL